MPDTLGITILQTKHEISLEVLCSANITLIAITWFRKERHVERERYRKTDPANSPCQRLLPFHLAIFFPATYAFNFDIVINGTHNSFCFYFTYHSSDLLSMHLYNHHNFHSDGCLIIHILKLLPVSLVIHKQYCTKHLYICYVLL